MGLGFNEIVTNSISNSKIYSEKELEHSVRLLNNLSADLDILRPEMLQTGLEILAYNINRKNNNLQFFEFGKTYHALGGNNYKEKEFFCFWITARSEQQSWKQKTALPDFFTAKGIIKSLLSSVNINNIEFSETETKETGLQQAIYSDGAELGKITNVDNRLLQKFDIHQSVVFVEADYENLLAAVAKQEIIYKEIPQQPAVERDLALVVDKKIKYGVIENTLKQLAIPYLQSFSLFDIFESDKIGKEKKSLAINFIFLDKEKTLTDTDVNAMMGKITKRLERDLNAEIRK
jgi:phenylalanyl-tRNA synthetase beta chain